MTDELSPFDRLRFEHERTFFALYGFKFTGQTETKAGPYFKLAHSLSEAIADLAANEGTHDEPLFVRDAFLERDGDEAWIHVELISWEEIKRIVESIDGELSGEEPEEEDEDD